MKQRTRITTKNQLVCRTVDSIKLMTEEINCKYNLSNNQTVVGYNISTNVQVFINNKDVEQVSTQLYFNPIANKVKTTSPSEPTEGTISTYVYFENNIQQVGINREVVCFNKAINKRSCNNPNRVINEQSYKAYSTTHNKNKAIRNIQLNIESNSIESYVEQSYGKLIELKTNKILKRLESIKASKVITELVSK